MKIPSLFRTARSSVRSVARRSATRGRAGFAPLEALEDRRLLSVSLVSGGTGAGSPAVEGALEPSVSADGNLIAFSSDANNFGANDTNGLRDVYLHNRATGTTVLVSRRSDGAAGNGASSEPSISTNGQFVSFSSTAIDIAGGHDPTNTTKDIYIYNVATGDVTLVSTNSSGGSLGQFSAEPNTNENGNFVAFTTPNNAGNLINGVLDTNSVRDVFLWNRTTGQSQLVSATAGGTAPNGPSFDPSVSPDGRWVAFRSEASDLVANDTNGKRDIFLRDMQTGQVILVSAGPGGAGANGDSDSPSVSRDGNVVVFSSLANNLTTDDGDASNSEEAARDIYVFTRSTGTVTLVSRNQARTGSGDNASGEPSVSEDGRYIAFTSAANDLIAGDTNSASDIFVFDVQTGAMNRVSVSDTGEQGNGDSTDANVAPQGAFVAFTSAATNLVPAGGDANGSVRDSFVASAPDRTPDQTNPPTASINQVDQPAAVVDEPLLQFVVSYADDVDLAPASFDSNDVKVILPGGGTPVDAQFVSSSGSGKSAKATYQIPAPGGTLDESDNGAYTIVIQPGEVQDANGNSVAAGNLSPAVQVAVTSGQGPDLVPSFPDPLPAVVDQSKGKVRVLVANQGGLATPKGSVMTLSLYLSLDGTIGEGDTLLAQQTKKFSAKPGKAKKYTMKFVYNAPGGGPNYQMLAFADSAGQITEARESNNIVAAPVTVAPAFVDLALAAGAVKPAGVSGRSFSIPVALTNNGNVPAVGSVTYGIVASTDDVLGNADDVTITPPAARNVKIKNAKTKKSKVKVTLPTLAGSYRFFVTATFTGTSLADTNTSDNTDSTDNTATIA
jgi:Tol biopolymer transport system component